jgi:hypothetical protein
MKKLKARQCHDRYVQITRNRNDGKSSWPCGSVNKCAKYGFLFYLRNSNDGISLRNRGLYLLGSKREELTEAWRKFRNLYSLPEISKIIKPEKVRGMAV